MRLRFLQTTPSDSPEYPFQAGQIITVAKLDLTHRLWIERGVAQLIDPEGETAALGAPAEDATVPRPKAKGPR